MNSRPASATAFDSTARRFEALRSVPLCPSYRTVTPASAASFSTASENVRLSSFWTNRNTSPPSPQPKQ